MSPGRIPLRYRPSIEAVCRRHGVALAELLSPCRIRPLYHARKVVAKVLRWQGMSTVEIGRLINRDHSTVCFYLNGKPGTRGVGL